MSQNWTPPPPPTSTPTNIPNYLVLSILSLFCCWPLAIVAIIFAAQVNGKVAAGDIQGAMSASKTAKLLSMISIGIGAVIAVIYILMFALGIGMSALSGVNR